MNIGDVVPLKPGGYAELGPAWLAVKVFHLGSKTELITVIVSLLWVLVVPLNSKDAVLTFARMSVKPIALDAYEALAEAYASVVDTKPHNAYYERPGNLVFVAGGRGQESSRCRLWSRRLFGVADQTRRRSSCCRCKGE